MLRLVIRFRFFFEIYIISCVLKFTIGVFFFPSYNRYFERVLIEFIVGLIIIYCRLFFFLIKDSSLNSPPQNGYVCDVWQIATVNLKVKLVSRCFLVRICYLCCRNKSGAGRQPRLRQHSWW